LASLLLSTALAPKFFGFGFAAAAPRIFPIRLLATVKRAQIVSKSKSKYNASL